MTDTMDADAILGLVAGAVTVTESQAPGFRSYDINDQENLAVGYRAEGVVNVDLLGYSWDTRVGFNANQFVLMSGSGDTQYSPFAVINGQVFMSSAFIQDGTITNAKIGDFIQSNNYVAGSVGWRLDKSGTFENYGSTAGEEP